MNCKWECKASIGSSICPSAVLCGCSDVDLSANCSNKGFSATPPGLPNQLRSLDMSRNQMKKINASEMFRLLSLEYLDLSHNRLTEFSMGDGFQQIHYNLRKLDLSYNKISSVKGLRLSGLMRLQELNLANNRIMSLPQQTLFEVGSSLRLLNLKSNKIVSLEPGCFSGLYALKELVLSKNKLSSFPKEIMPNLEVLELNKNKFVEIEGLMFHGLGKLKVMRKYSDVAFWIIILFIHITIYRKNNLIFTLICCVLTNTIYGIFCRF